jgi:predicted kinase
MPTLYVTVGLPRSGKSTWARCRDLPIVNPDSIRLEIHGKEFDAKHEGLVWWTTKIMVASLFRVGHSAVILDSTMMTHARRQEWKSKDYETIYVIFNTPQAECERRAVAEGRPHMVGVIQRMALQYEPVDHRVESCICP